MKPESKLTSQGQLTMPAEIRRRAGVHAGTRFTWEVDGHGNIILSPKRVTLDEFIGMFKSNRIVSDEEIRQAIEEGYASRFH